MFKTEKDTIDDGIVSEDVKEVKKEVTEQVVETSKKPKRKEPKVDISVASSSAVIEVPVDCGDSPEVDALIGQMATAKALAMSKARIIIKAVRNSKTIAVESRPVLDLSGKKLIVNVTFKPAINEDFVELAQESV